MQVEDGPTSGKLLLEAPKCSDIPGTLKLPTLDIVGAIGEAGEANEHHDWENKRVELVQKRFFTGWIEDSSARIAPFW